MASMTLRIPWGCLMWSASDSVATPKGMTNKGLCCYPPMASLAARMLSCRMVCTQSAHAAFCVLPSGPQVAM